MIVWKLKRLVLSLFAVASLWVDASMAEGATGIFAAVAEAPEINPALASSALALVAGSVFLFSQRFHGGKSSGEEEN